MAGDWLKWRVDLQTHPRFITLANDLIYNEDRIGLLVYVCGEDALDIGVFPPSNKSVTERALRCVTEQALRDVTLSKLMVVWGAVNAHGKVRGNDATMEPMLASEIDHIAGVDGFGAAMEFAGWVREESNNVLVFPNFLEFNEPACLRAKPKSNAERQAEFRARRKAEKEASNDPVTKVTKSNAREEKRREESNTHTHTDARTREEQASPAPLKTWDAPAGADPIVIAAVDDWQAYRLSVDGRHDSGVRIDALIAEATRKGWAAAKIAASVQFSIAKGAKSWIDSDLDFEQQRKQTQTAKSDRKPTWAERHAMASEGDPF